MLAMSSSNPANSSRRDRKLTRSNSLVGSIKNLFTGFFRTSDPAQDDFEHSNGKRRAIDQNGPDLSVDATRQYGSRTKKMRVGSPSRSAHLDPPGPPQFNFSFTPPSHLSNVTIPSTTIQPSNNQHFRKPLSRHATPISRTMSMDPPAHSPPRESQLPFHTSSSVPHMSMSHRRDSSIRDVSMPPIPVYAPPRASSLRMSLTPQPSGSKFGPSSLGKHPSEPPTLDTLREHPSFVRQPTLERTHSLSQSTVTLGSLVDSRRSTRSPVRKLFGSQVMPDTTPQNSDSPAEKLLSDLEAYRTPFLPSRLRHSSIDPVSNSNIVPGMVMFEREKKGSPILMRDRGTRRVSGGKYRRKDKDEIFDGEEKNEGKPYAGVGGMKKLLSRRKMEVVREKDRKGVKEMKDASVVTEAEYTTRHRSPQPTPLDTKVASPPRQVKVNGHGYESSGLRVGRSKTNRHAPSAKVFANNGHGNRFSAVYDEGAVEDEEDERRVREMKELEDAAGKVPEFKIPDGFSFAKTEEATSTTTDQCPQRAENEDAPIEHLPFSSTEPSHSTTTVPNPPVPPAPPTSVHKPSFLPSENLKPADTNSVVPNFFVDSTLLNRHIEESSPLPLGFDSGNGGSSSSRSLLPVKDADSTLCDGGNEHNNQEPLGAPVKLNAGLASGEPSKPNSSGSLFGQHQSTIEGLGLPKPNGSTFGDQFLSFGGTPDASVTTVVQPPSPPPTQSRENATSTSASPFRFGKPTPVELPKGPPPVLSDAVIPPTPLRTTPFGGFGDLPASTAAPAPSLETPKPPAFSFGQSSALPSPTPEAPKPLFGSGGGGFSFGQPPVNTPTPAAGPDRDSSQGPFSFGATPSTPPPAGDNHPAFSFGNAAPSSSAAPTTSSAFSFGTGNTAPSHGVLPFTFGAETSTSRPVTPPKNNSEQEFRMEESPTRDTQSKPAAAINGFSFEGGGSTLFGQTSISTPSPFSFGAQTTNENPFVPKKETKPEESKSGSSGGFGDFMQRTTSSGPSSGFMFGQPPKSETDPSPSTMGSFSFVGGPQTPTTSQPSFAFTAPTINTNSGFNAQSTSAPSSPSTFNQTNSGGFTFSPAKSNPPAFSFGSNQPVSPINRAASQSSQPQTPSSAGGFTFGQSSTSNGDGQTSPFTSTAPPAGGALFTIGSAPPAQRQIRKLPNRRAGGKR